MQGEQHCVQLFFVGLILPTNGQEYQNGKELIKNGQESICIIVGTVCATYNEVSFME